MPDNDWFSSEQGRANMRSLLETSGIPLELRARKIATEVVSKIDPKEMIAEGAHLTFRDLNDGPREIDWAVTYRAQPVRTEHVDVHVRMVIPIECKHRTGVEWFAFEVPGQTAGNPTTISVPVLSDSARLCPSFEANVNATHSLNFAEHRLTHVKLAKQGGTSKQTVESESMVMAAACATLDYMDVLADRVIRGGNPVIEARGEVKEEWLREFGQFVADADEKIETRDQLLAAIQAFVGTQFPAQRHSDFLTAMETRRIRQRVEVLICVPLLVVSGPLYHVRMSPDVVIQEFATADFAATSVYEKRWPDAYRDLAIGPDAGLPVVVASIQGFTAALDYLANCVRATKHVLSQSHWSILNALPLQIAVRDSIIDDYEKRMGADQHPY